MMAAETPYMPSVIRSKKSQFFQAVTVAQFLLTVSFSNKNKQLQKEVKREVKFTSLTEFFNKINKLKTKNKKTQQNQTVILGTLLAYKDFTKKLNKNNNLKTLFF